MRTLVITLGIAAAAAALPAQAQTVTIKLETYAGPRHAMNTHGWPEWIKRHGQRITAPGRGIRYRWVVHAGPSPI